MLTYIPILGDDLIITPIPLVAAAQYLRKHLEVL